MMVVIGRGWAVILGHFLGGALIFFFSLFVWSEAAIYQPAVGGRA